MYTRIFKRLFDFSAALIAVLLLAPVMLIIGVLLHFSNKGAGVFFTQVRPGRNERTFRIVKFKTMTNERDAEGNLLPDAQRLTKIGSALRRASLDELPQLFNVLNNDMAIVGPRPLLPEYLPLYSQEQKKRHLVLPGITGWAQVNGRNAISWKEKFELDVWYAENVSLFVDLKIILLTIVKIFKKEGIYLGQGVASMEAFNGRN